MRSCERSNRVQPGNDLTANGGFVKPGGLVGIAGAGVVQDIQGAVPEHLHAWWTQDQGWCLHSATWWRRHWEQSGIMDIEVADTMPDG